MKSACVLGLSAVCALGVAGCSNSSTAPGSSNDGSVSGGVAATVNGEPISEDLVTNYIESLRAQYGLTDEGSWGQYLAASSLTPESLRENIINSYVELELMEEGAAAAGALTGAGWALEAAGAAGATPADTVPYSSVTSS